MRIVGQFLFSVMLVSALQVSVNAQVQMKLGGPSTYVANRGLQGPDEKSPFDEASPVLPKAGNTQAPTQMPQLGTIGIPSTAPRVDSSYPASRSILQEVPQVPHVPQAIGEITYPDPVTAAPQPAPISSSDLLGINSSAPQIQNQHSYAAPIQPHPSPNYETFPSLGGQPHPSPNYETLPSLGGDYYPVVESDSIIVGSLPTSGGYETGSPSCSDCGDCDHCGGTGFAGGLGGRGFLTRDRRAGGRLASRARGLTSRAGGRLTSLATRRTTRRGNARSCLLGGDCPSYMFVDFGGYFGRGTATLEGSNLSFEQDDNLLFGAGVGRYLCNNFRVDLSGRYRFAEIDGDSLIDASSPFQVQNIDGGTEIFTTMLIGRYDLPGFRGCIKPYFSAGVGVAYGRSHGSATTVGANSPFDLAVLNAEGFPSNEETTFAYVLGGGVSMKMTDKMYFDLDYQYTAFNEDRETGASFSGNRIQFDNLAANEVAFRLRFNF